MALIQCEGGEQWRHDLVQDLCVLQNMANCQLQELPCPRVAPCQWEGFSGFGGHCSGNSLCKRFQPTWRRMRLPFSDHAQVRESRFACSPQEEKPDWTCAWQEVSVKAVVGRSVPAVLSATATSTLASGFENTCKGFGRIAWRVPAVCRCCQESVAATQLGWPRVPRAYLCWQARL